MDRFQEEEAQTYEADESGWRAVMSLVPLIAIAPLLYAQSICVTSEIAGDLGMLVFPVCMQYVSM